MNTPAQKEPYVPEGRLLSLDFFRGATMFLLVGEFTHLFSSLTDATQEGSLLHAFFMQFHHQPWQGLHFWDLVQPFFMFIVGVAIPFSVAKRVKQGQSEKELLRHAVVRSLTLLFLGWALYCIGPGRITFRFQNVLAQLSFTYLLAFVIRNKPFRYQLIFSLALLLITELIYRFFPVAGFNHPFTPNQNFGTWLDLQYGGADLRGHWVSFNAVPTAAHTIWGVLAGNLLISKIPQKEKFIKLAVAGIIGIAVGYALNPLTPVIKRIATSSFVIMSGGWALLVLALSYWLIDIKKSRRWVIFFAVVGMNPLFIYLFAHLDGKDFLEHMYKPFTHLLFSPLGETGENILTSAVIWATFWYMTWWMYKRKIFIKI
jgi:predicted acyltransferase